jgi:uncharacterized protein (TIGR02569 family)
VPAPPPHVLAAFGTTAEPEPLAGGEGRAWLSGELVLKPRPWSMSAEELEWQGELFDSLRCNGFRVPRLRGAVDGWCAWERLEGRHREAAWPEVISAGERFHAALAFVSRPAFIDGRSDHWAVGDRVAWGELYAERFHHVKHVRRLLDALHPVGTGDSQLVHGDLTGNVLFADGLPPAVIDFSPYWRPPAFASAVVVADALVWEGADESLLDAVGHIADFPQFLLRALIYRAVVDALFRAREPQRPDEDDEFLAPVELACRLAA